MKKILMINMAVYTVVCVGVYGIMLFKPELYGKWVGKMTNGIVKALED